MIKFDEKKAPAVKGISLQEKQKSGQLITTIPSGLKDNGLDWKGGDELDFYYDKSADILMIKHQKSMIGRSLVLPGPESDMVKSSN